MCPGDRHKAWVCQPWEGVQRRIHEELPNWHSAFESRVWRAESSGKVLSKVHTFVLDGRYRRRKGWWERLMHLSHPAPWAGRAVRQAAVLTHVPLLGISAESTPLRGKLKSELRAGLCGACFLHIEQQNETHFCRVSSLFCGWWLMPALRCFVSLQRSPSVDGDQRHDSADWCHAWEMNVAQVGKDDVFSIECHHFSCHYYFLSLTSRLCNTPSPSPITVLYRPSNSNDLSRSHGSSDWNWAGNGILWRI